MLHNVIIKLLSCYIIMLHRKGSKTCFYQLEMSSIAKFYHLKIQAVIPNMGKCCGHYIFSVK